MQRNLVLPLDKLALSDIEIVGGKNASLGEMLQNLTKLGLEVPNGFATTSFAYKQFLESNGIDKLIAKELSNLDVDNIPLLSKAGKTIRDAILRSPLPKDLEAAIKQEYDKLIKSEPNEISFAVRSSATAEDLPDASFAGQQDTILNVYGFDNILTAVREVFSSLFTDRAIAYRDHNNFDHTKVLLSVGIQKMIRSDLGSSGVMFTLDTESGFDKVIFITSALGLGELVVQGSVNPDEFYVEKRALIEDKKSIVTKHLGRKQQKMVYNDNDGNDKVVIKETTKLEQNSFSLTDTEVETLARHALIIESHYKKPMDIEWAKDGKDGKIYIVQARPETVQSKNHSMSLNLEKYHLKQKSEILTEGRSVGHKIGVGNARLINSLKDMHDFKEGEVLVTDMTDPDWEPIMKRSAAIVTNRGGRTCHAAIIARELGIPAIVGCLNATDKIKDGEEITVSCAEGDIGHVYKGKLEFEVKKDSFDKLPELNVNLMMNLANPNQAFLMQQLPNAGVGLARMEFIINQVIGVHPKACLEFGNLPEDIKNKVADKSVGYKNPVSFYKEKLAEGIATLATAFYPKPVIVRMSDFKTNEYANLIGGNIYEPEEENPMLGYRGASRYISEGFRDCFALECAAIKKVREEYGLTNVQIMIPFVRTVNEAKSVMEELHRNNLKRGKNDLKVIMMCEIPSNAILAEDFLKYFDGFSIGSNDLTQLTLGLDRDSGIVADTFNEQDPAVLALLDKAITTCNKAGKYIGICGQGPSDHPEFAKWLIERNITSISLTPDSILPTWKYMADNKVGVK